MISLVYSTGTVSVSNASAIVTGTGTSWDTALVTGGIFSFAGMSVPIATVENDTSLTLAYPWPGTTASGAYAITRETSEAVRAAWINDRMARLMTKPWGTGVVPDGRGKLAERDALSPMPTDKYCWLRKETSFDPTLYFKTPSGWIGPYPLVGEQGPAGVGVGGYGLPAGGTTGQVPVKSSGVDGAVAWGAIDQSSVDTQSTLATTRGDAAYVILATDRNVLLTAALTVARTWSLPAASAYKAGRRLTIRDAVGGVSSTNTLTVQRAGTDTIDGATTLVLDVPWEGAELVSDGVAAWSVLTVGAGNTKARRRRSLGFDDTTAAPNVGDAFKWNGTLWVPSKAREVLTANRTYYVRTDGSNSNNGLANTSGGAFLTLQKTWDTILGLDLGGFDVTIQIADGTYANGIVTTKGPIGGNALINGKATTPGNVIVSKTAGDCFNFSAPCRVELRNLETRMKTSGDCVAASYGALVVIGVGLRFGACAAAHMRSTSGGSIQNVAANYSIVASAPYHMFGAGGRFLMANSTVTLSGTPAFSAAFAAIQEMSSLIAYGSTYSGSATGLRYFVSMNSIIQIYGGGASYLPGSTAGSADTGSGGRYA